MNIAVFCSGNGSNFQAIAEASKKGLAGAKIALMVCDNSSAYAIERAKKESIKTFIIERANFPSREEFEKEIIAQLEKEKIGLICLAGYMRMLSASFVEKYRGRILNVHPALLPSFKGTQAIKDALESRVKTTGATVHFVNEEMDAGPIILQEAVKIEAGDTEEMLEQKIHSVEHRIYPEAIRLFIERKIKVIGKKVKILAVAAIFFFIFGFESEAMLGSSIAPALPIEPEPVRIEYIKMHKLSLGIERPLPKEEIEKMRIEHSIKAARIVAEVMYSMNADFAYNGINSLINTATRVISFRNQMKEKYHLHFRVSKDKALLRHKKRF